MTMLNGTASRANGRDITRFVGGRRCPICGGCDDDPRGEGRRCWGFLSGDGNYAHCVREDRAGGIPITPTSGTYAHRLNGPCKCGSTHGVEIPGIPKRGTKGRAKGERIARLDFVYRDEAGRPLFREVREEYLDAATNKRSKKTWTEVRVGGDEKAPEFKGYKDCMKDARLVPFGLPELLILERGATIYIVEGPKKALALRALGLNATCNPYGAEKWRDEFSRFLEGLNVVILPDENRVGRKHAELVARSVRPFAASVRVVPLPDLAEGEDILDWLEKGRSTDELRAIAAAEWEPLAQAGGTGGGGDGPPRDGDGESNRRVEEEDNDPHRLARIFLNTEFRHADGPTLINHRGEYFRWDGTKYVSYLDTETDLVGSIKDEFDRINIRDIERMITSSREKGDAIPTTFPKVAKVTTKLVKDVMQALRSEACIASHLDAPAWIGEGYDATILPDPCEVLPAQNGLVDLRTLAVLPSTPRFYCPFSVPYAYVANPPAPVRWLKFLDEIWPNEPDSIRELQKWMGYLLSIDKSQEKALLVVGPRRSGKGTLITVMEALIGRENTVATCFKDLAGRFGLWPLVGKAAAFIPDARFTGAGENNDQLIERLLSITSRDPVSVDMKYLKPVSMRLPTRLLVFSNETPNLRENSGALSGRFSPLKLSQTFFGREDPGLAAILVGEISGITRWAIDGREMLRDDGRFLVPISAASTHEALRQLSSPMVAFAEECCDILPADPRDDRELTTIRHIHQAYQWWCKITKRESSSDNIFGRNLSAAFPHITDVRPRSDDGTRLRRYRGIQLNATGDDYRRRQEDWTNGIRPGQTWPTSVRTGPQY